MGTLKKIGRSIKKAVGKTPMGQMLGIGVKKHGSGGGGGGEGLRNVARQGGAGQVSFQSSSTGPGLHDRGKAPVVKKQKTAKARSAVPWQKRSRAAAASQMMTTPTSPEEPIL